uniref:Uncharacterized protein n=1 Tax=Triticum urartu TaxID=4572 RepID=A0A8R7QVS6_TRIUA
MYPNLYCSRVKTFFYATGKSDYEFPFLFVNPYLYPLSPRPLSSDQIKEIDQTIPVPAQIMIFTNLDLVLSRLFYSLVSIRRSKMLKNSCCLICIRQNEVKSNSKFQCFHRFDPGLFTIITSTPEILLVGVN